MSDITSMCTSCFNCWFCFFAWMCAWMILLQQPQQTKKTRGRPKSLFLFLLLLATSFFSHDVHQQRHPAHKFLRNKRPPEVATEWRKTIARDPCFWRRFRICSCPEATSERRFLIFRPSISSREVWRGLSLPVTWTSTLMCCMTTTQL